MKSTPQEIENAVSRFQSGDFRSLVDAETKTGVNRQTISARLSGTQSHQVAHGKTQKLAPEQEKLLVKWILTEDEAGKSPSYHKIREMAEEILAACYGHERIG
jgi:hypothetical protein